MRPLLLTLMVASAFGGNVAFCQTVKVAPYYSAGPGTSQLTSSAATDTSVDWIASGQTDRTLIPRTGSISKVRLYIADRTAISNIYFGVCRWSSGSTWNVAQWTPAIGGPYFANEVNTFTLATPLVAEKYDVLCGRIEWSTPHAQNLAALSPISLPAITGNGNTAQAENCYYQLNAARPASLTTSSMTVIPGNGCPVIEAWMTRPDIVGIGDSIIQKDDSNADAAMVLTRPLSSSVGQSGFSIPYYATVKYSGMTYQDMGWGGQTTTQIQARFAQDALALKPSYIVLNGGVNDVYVNCSTTSGCTSGQMIAIENSLAAMMAAAQSVGTKTFVMLIGPWTGNGSDATNAQMASIDSINANTIAVAPGYGAAVIDQRCVVGQQRASGPAGNCWDIQPQYLYGDGLGVHLNPAGEQRVANLISLSLGSFQYGGRVILKGGVAQK